MDIPEDVMKAAMLHLRSMEQDTEERGNGQWVVKGFGVRNAIARAILAERERCAKVCEAVGSDLDPQYADHIAAAIRATPNQTGEVDRT